MSAAENPLDVLRKALDDQPFHMSREAWLGCWDALSAVEQLVEAARAAVDSAPGYTARRGSIWRLDRELDRLREALARFPVPAQDTGGET